MAFENAIYLGDVDGHMTFLVKPPVGPWFGRALLHTGRVCRTSVAAMLPGMPVEIRVNSAGDTLLNWRHEGQDEPGFSMTEYMHRNGLTHETRHRRTDVQLWLDRLGFYEGSVATLRELPQTGTPRTTFAREGIHQGEKQ